MQVVEGVEEFLLRTLLAADELDVIDEQRINMPVFGTKGVSRLMANR